MPFDFYSGVLTFGAGGPIIYRVGERAELNPSPSDTKLARAEAALRRIFRGPGDFVAISDLKELADKSGFGFGALQEAKKRLGLESERERGFPARVLGWRVPGGGAIENAVAGGPRKLDWEDVAESAPRPEPEVKVASSYEPPVVAERHSGGPTGPRTLGTTEARLNVARQRLRRIAFSQVLKLEELTEELIRLDGKKCPTCGRGTRRDEDLRLRAIVAALDRAGLGPSAKLEVEGEGGGPVLVFPPGTGMAIVAAPVGRVEEGVGRPVVDEGVRVTRASEYVVREDPSGR